MTWSEVEKTDVASWTFRVDDRHHHLDAPAAAKKEVADEHDIRYSKLRARVVNRKGFGDTFVTVVDAFDILDS